MEEKIKTVCTYCSAEFAVPQGYIYKKVRCAKCKEIFVVEASEQTFTVEEPPLGRKDEEIEGFKGVSSTEETELDVGGKSQPEELKVLRTVKPKPVADEWGRGGGTRPEPPVKPPMKKPILDKPSGGIPFETIIVFVASAASIATVILPWRFIANTSVSGFQFPEGNAVFAMAFFLIALDVGVLLLWGSGSNLKGIFALLMIGLSLVILLCSIMCLVGRSTQGITLGVGQFMALGCGLLSTFMTVLMTVRTKVITF